MAKGILEHVHLLLQEAGEPLDVQDITTRLLKQGHLPDDGKKERHHLYTRLYMDIAYNGENSRFRKIGRGVFCLTGQEASVAETPNTAKVCGNCQHISYSGIQELILLTGYCENNDNSERYYVARNAEPCRHWRRRSPDKVTADKIKRDKLRHKVDLFNIRHRGKRKPL